MTRCGAVQNSLGLAVVLLILSPGAALANPVQWAGNGHWYEGVSPGTTISWSEAKNAAEARGGFLATITSAAENEFVFSLVADDAFWNPSYGWSGPWLGGNQPEDSPEPDGNWQWVTSETWAYSNWDAGQPNNIGNLGPEDCLQFYSVLQPRASTWNDCANYYPVRGPVAYVVEYVPEPATLALLGLGGLAVLRRRGKRPLTTMASGNRLGFYRQPELHNG